MPRLRTFIAIELSSELLNRLQEVQRDLQKRVPPQVVRWVRPQGIHLTLKFLGEVPAERIQAITQAVERACTGVVPFTITAGGLGCFPNLRRPRVVWVGVDEPTGNLSRLQQAVEAQLEALGYPREGRAFHPHLTLGRVQRRAASSEVRELGEKIAAITLGELGQMRVSEVHVMRSDLRPDGAVYTALAVVPLAGA